MLLIENIKEKQIKKFLNQDFDPKLIFDFSNYFEIDIFNLIEILNLLSPSLSKYLNFYLDKKDIIQNNKAFNSVSQLANDLRYDFYDEIEEEWCEKIRQKHNLPHFNLENIIRLNSEKLNNEIIEFDNEYNEEFTGFSVKYFGKIKVETIGEFIKIFKLIESISSKIKTEGQDSIKDGLLALMLKDLPYDNGFSESQNRVFLEFQKIHSVKRDRLGGINTSYYLKHLEREARKATLYKKEQGLNKKRSEFSESQVNLILNKGVERIYDALSSLLKMLFYVKHLKIIEPKMFLNADFEYYFNEDKYQARLKESHKTPHFKKVAIIETLLGSIEAYLKEAEQIIKEVKNAK